MATKSGVNAPPAESTADMSRRNFLTFIGFGALTATLGGTALGGVRFMFPNVLYEPPSRLKIGMPTKFGDGTYTFIEEKKVYIRRVPEGFQAISAVCQHLACTVKWMGAEFVCPCHGSVYAKDGERVAGPAPRGLDHFSIELARDGQMVIDLSQVITKTDYFKA